MWADFYGDPTGSLVSSRHTYRNRRVSRSEGLAPPRQNAGQASLFFLFCLACDPICLRSLGPQKSARFPSLISSIILLVSYGAAPLAVYHRRFVIA